MIKRSLAALLVAVLLLTPTLSFAYVQGGQSVSEYYELGLTCFYWEDYEAASANFSSAGNYKDAKKWKYYCDAIAMVNAGKISDALARFELLKAQDFQQSSDWFSYCTARLHENSQMITDVLKLYSQLVIHDSIERYLACKGFGDLLESAEDVRSRMQDEDINTTEAYAKAKDLYYLEFYSDAADYFCLAGNYQDARLWRCYCEAISLITSDGSLANAQLLFDLLNTHHFMDSADWLTYCKARSFESIGFYDIAIDHYKTIFLYDSSERYLALLAKPAK